MQKKIRLEMEKLEVETFAPAEGPSPLRGTVHGRNGSRFDCTYDFCQQQTVSGTWPCLCASAAGEYSCDTTCNPDQCDCLSAPCVSVGGQPCG